MTVVEFGVGENQEISTFNMNSKGEMPYVFIPQRDYDSWLLAQTGFQFTARTVGLLKIDITYRMDRQCCLVETPRWKPPGGFPPQNGGNPPASSYYDIGISDGGFPPS